jgi:hypothetical protein
MEALQISVIKLKDCVAAKDYCLAVQYCQDVELEVSENESFCNSFSNFFCYSSWKK